LPFSQVHKLEVWRSMKPWRVLTEERLAKLLGLLISHWLTVLGCWQTPNRSLVKAKQVMDWMAPALALALTGEVSMKRVLKRTIRTMQRGCPVQSRRKRPATFQWLEHPQLNSS
jgi:hypothetical protein